MRFALITLIPLAALAQPSFTMQRLNAPPLSFSHYHGKILAVAFISTECPHCQNLTRILVPLAHDYAPRGVQFLECAFNENAQLVMKDFIERFNPPFPVGWNSPAAVRAFLHYSILDPNLFVPHMQFYDRAGKLRDDVPGENDFFKMPEQNIRAELDKLLKGSARPAATAKK